MSADRKQSTFFRGIYEFEDPSGSLIVAKVPVTGTVDLYSGTVVIVKPSQTAIFVYKGQIADILLPGTHDVRTENLPVLTKLANWKFGFQSPLRCEIIFMAGQIFTSRRWGSPQPVLVNFKNFGPVPVRAYGNFNVTVTEPIKFFSKLVGSRSTYSIAELDNFIQGQIVQFLPEVFGRTQTLQELSGSYNELSLKIETVLNNELAEFGIAVQKIQILSALPSKEILEAIDAKMAMQIIGSQKDYLFYKAANSLDVSDGESNDSMQMMLGLMLGKGLIGNDQNRDQVTIDKQSHYCSSCGSKFDSKAIFCSQCGRKLS